MADSITDKEVAAAAAALFKEGRRHHWWRLPQERYEDLDPIGREEFEALVWRVLKAAEAARGDAPFHAHIYFSADERDAAAKLRERFRTAKPDDPLSGIRFVGALRDHKVGPHTVPQFEIHFEERLLPIVEPELVRSGLRVLIHPLTLDDLGDHTHLGRWIGTPVELDLSVLDPPGVNQGFARYGKTDF
jgi:aromatic ring-cleaving dioxygenase